MPSSSLAPRTASDKGIFSSSMRSAWGVFSASSDRTVAKPPRVLARLQSRPLSPLGKARGQTPPGDAAHPERPPLPDRQKTGQRGAVAPCLGLEPEVFPRQHDRQAVLSKRSGQDDPVARTDDRKLVLGY